jgi:hypothetical protein
VLAFGKEKPSSLQTSCAAGAWCHIPALNAKRSVVCKDASCKELVFSSPITYNVRALGNSNRQIMAAHACVLSMGGCRSLSAEEHMPCPCQAAEAARAPGERWTAMTAS